MHLCSSKTLETELYDYVTKSDLNSHSTKKSSGPYKLSTWSMEISEAL